MLLRFLLSQALGGAVSKIGKCWYRLVSIGLLVAIVTLKLVSSIELIKNRRSLHLFEVVAGKTLVVLWLEVQV